MVTATRKTRRHKCPECHGLKYKEYEHGLIRVPCQKCSGTGFVAKKVK